MESFWQELPKPFLILAPMADVTDAAFRQIVAMYGKADVMYTEFTSADGLMHPKGREKLLVNLRYAENERPIVAQLFGSKVETMRGAAALCRELGFDGLDINMGCPDRTIEKQGAGASLIKNPKLAEVLIKAAEEGFGHPVSVKTRLGYSRIDEWEEWLGAIAEAKPVSVTVHLRTRKEMSKVPAHWELAKVVGERLRERGILAIGNGDVMSLAEAKEKAEKYNLDGIMIGKGIFGNPYLFANLACARHNCQIEHPEQSRRIGPSRDEVPVEERMRIMVEHAHLFEECFGERKSFAVMRKFFKAYIAGHEQAKEIQEKLMACENAGEVESVVKSCNV